MHDLSAIIFTISRLVVILTTDLFFITVPLVVFTLSTSFLSFLRTLAGVLEYSVINKIGKLKEAGLRQKVLYSLFALTASFTHFMLGGFLIFLVTVHGSPEENILGILALSSIFSIPLTTGLLQVFILGFSFNNFISGILSRLAPFNFFGKSLSITKCYLFVYTSVQEVQIMCAYVLFAVSIHHSEIMNESIVQFVTLCYFIVPLGFMALVKWIQIIYIQFALTTSYKESHMCYPSFKKVENRRNSYPPWFDLKNTMKSITLTENGHFYSDLRLLQPITSCFSCGKTIKWQFLLDDDMNKVKYHDEDCRLSTEDKVLVRNNLVIRNDTRTTCNWITTVLGGSFFLAVIIHVVVVTVLTEVPSLEGGKSHGKQIFNNKTKTFVISDSWARPTVSSVAIIISLARF